MSQKNANAENDSQRFEQKYSPISRFLSKLYESLLVSAGNSPFSVMLKVLQLSWVIDVDSFFTKSTQNLATWRRVLWTWWPKATPDNAVIADFQQESCCVRNMGGRPFFLKSAIPFVFSSTAMN
jgi:hypothetical protein